MKRDISGGGMPFFCISKGLSSGQRKIFMLIPVYTLRLLQTFLGILQEKKKFMCAVFKETPTNYISTKRLLKCRIRLNYILFWILLSKGGKGSQLQNDQLTFQQINRVSNAIVHTK